MSASTSNEISKAINLEKFRNASSKTLEKFISNIKYSLFKEKYPEIDRAQPEFLKTNFKQMKTQLQDQIKEDLDELYTDKALFLKLQQLECLTKKACDENNSTTWRPSGNPNEDIRDHRNQFKLRHKKALELILNGYQKQNQQLEKKMNENHEEILNLKKSVFEMEEQNDSKLEALITNGNFEVMEYLHPIVEEN